MCVNNANDPGNQGIAVLEALLRHEPDLLDISSLGALSSCNKLLMSLTEPQWKVIWERFVEIGAEFKHDLGGMDGFRLISWIGETGLLGCFTDPNAVEACRFGYKHAVGCLKSKVCFKCGDMTSQAHPFTLTRLCKRCADNDQESWLIPKSKAKAALLLGEADLKALRSVTIPYKTLTGNDATSVLFLLNDAVEHCFSKYGGADGLEAAFEEKKRAALAKYEKSQSTQKPQKKKPKVMKMLNRPTEDLEDLKGSITTVPIGSIFQHWDYDAKEKSVGMTHAARCPFCPVGGCPHDLALHARLEHQLICLVSFIISIITNLVWS